jgi:hypothetical protein
MPPKAKRAVEVESSESSQPGVSDDGSEEAAIRLQFDEYHKALRVANDLKKRDSPVSLLHFAKEAWQEGFGRSVESIYSLYKRAIKNQYADPIAPRGRPSKKPNPLEIHTFAVQAAANAKSGKVMLTPTSLATFDKFSAAQKNDPRAHTLHGTKLQEFVDEVRTCVFTCHRFWCSLSTPQVKRMEPRLTTTRAIATSADRMDGTAANIMEAYYASIDDLHEAYPIFDQEPSRTMNFDELALNNRGEYVEETLQAFTAISLLKLLRGRIPHRTTALNDGSGNVTLIPFILGGNILLGDAFIGAVKEGSVKPDWSAPAKWTQRAAVGMPFLPGMRGNHFDGKRTRVFATESGSNNSNLLEYMLIEWCVRPVILIFGLFVYCSVMHAG